jgi:hypothetical protein
VINDGKNVYGWYSPLNTSTSDIEWKIEPIGVSINTLPFGHPGSGFRNL